MTMSNTLSNVVIPTDPSFQFNGLNSDLAQQFYLRHVAGKTAPSLPLTHANLPDDIKARLSNVSLVFDNLPGLLQRALVWDSGYAFTSTNQLVEVQTVGGIPMSQLAIPVSTLHNIQCEYRNCTQPDAAHTLWFKNEGCNGATMLTVVNCATMTPFKEPDTSRSMWSTGGNPEVIPSMYVHLHNWTVYSISYLVTAIHTLSDDVAPPYASCGAPGTVPTADAYGSITIPCYPAQLVDTVVKGKMAKPRLGPIVTPWLQSLSTKGSESKSESEGFNLILLIPTLLGMMVVVAIVFWCVRHQKKKRSSEKNDSIPVVSVLKPGEISQSLIPGSTTWNSVDTPDQYHGSSSGSTTHYSNITTTSILPRESIWDDPVLLAVRVPLEKVELVHLLNRGGYGEVYYGYYNGNEVAIKRLLPEKRKDMKQIESFRHEVQTIARMEHPHIVRFIGVAWESLADLVLLIEYMHGGDLRSVLNQWEASQRIYGFDYEKLQMAQQIAHALTYMHSLQPMVLHRDLKSKNILLTERYDAKITDFGISRERGDVMMTVGVGTSLWMAPEVMLGEQYDEKADVFSFGVVLSELDTHALPYSQAKEQGDLGLRLPETAILQMVTLGRLRVSFSEHANVQMVQLAYDCVAMDASQRPTAAQVLHRILCIIKEEEAVGSQEYVF